MTAQSLLFKFHCTATLHRDIDQIGNAQNIFEQFLIKSSGICISPLSIPGINQLEVGI